MIHCSSGVYSLEDSQTSLIINSNNGVDEKGYIATCFIATCFIATCFIATCFIATGFIATCLQDIALLVESQLCLH